MKRLLVLLSLVGFISGCILEDNKGTEIRVGDSLPEFEVVMNNGDLVSDSSLKGTPSMVMFFHTSCPDCQQTLPVVQKIYEEYSPKDFKIVLISREDTNDDIRAYWEENGLNLPYSAQEDRSVYKLFASSRIPRIYMSDENGTVRYIFTDDPVPSYDVLKSALESLIR
jgi:peroxiredoxin